MFNVLKCRLKLYLKKDYLIMVVMLGMGILLTYIFGMAFSSGGYAPKAMVVDLDQSAQSEALIASLNDNHQFKIQVTEDRSEAENEVEQSWAFIALVIPEGFSQGDAKLELVKVHDVMETWAFSQKVSNGANQIIGDQSFAKELSDAVKEIGGDVSEDSITTMLSAARDNPAVQVSYEKDKGGNLTTLMHNLIGFILFFSTFTVVFVAAYILEDKMDGTWDRLMVSPTKRTAVLAGNLIFAFLMGMVQVVAMVLLGQYLFGVQWGDHIGLVIGMLSLFILCLTCFGLFMAGACKSMSQLSSIVPMVLTGAAMLGGCMWPLEIITFKPIIYLGKCMPHYWALTSLEKMVLWGRDPGVLLVPALILAGMSIGWFALGLWRLNKNYK